MTLEYSGRTTAYEHKHEEGWQANTFAGPNALRDVAVIEAQWSNMPIEVEQDVKDIWRYLDFGNDNYYWKTSIYDILEMLKDEGHGVGLDVERFITPPAGESYGDNYGWQPYNTKLEYLLQWMEEQGLEETESVLIHWWW